MNDRVVDFVLADAEARHAEKPRHFFIPSRGEREGLAVGELAKLLFELVDPQPGLPGAERMWVEVTGRDENGYVGRLTNQPSAITTIREGDALPFGPQHVISVIDNWPLLEKKVFVTRRSQQYDLRPRRVYRDDPVDERDSGWCALVGDETDDEVNDPASVLAQQLGYLLDRWPELRPVFETDPANGEWVWHEHIGSYLALDPAGSETEPKARRRGNLWPRRRSRD